MPFPVDQNYVKKLVLKMDVIFPESFHTNITTINGGEIDTGQNSWRLFPVFDKSDTKRLKRTSFDILHETMAAKSWAGFPDNGISIDTNDSGDFLILLPRDNNKSILKDVVYDWGHETGKTRIKSPTIEILMNSRRKQPAAADRINAAAGRKRSEHKH